MEQISAKFEWDLDGLAKDELDFPVLLCTDYE